MKLFDILKEISTLTTKAETSTLNLFEHRYLQKLISAVDFLIYSEGASESENFCFNENLKHYLNILNKNSKNLNFSKKEKTELCFFQHSLLRKVKNLNGFCYKNDIKRFDRFNILKNIAGIWDFNLNRDEYSLIEFIKFIMKNIYEIPFNLIDEVFNLINSNWKSLDFALDAFPDKLFSLKEIENYFFGSNIKINYNLNIFGGIDRYFSVFSPGNNNHLFLPKNDQFSLFEASLIVHEFQHFLDSKYEENENDSLKSKTECMYNCEKSALNSERIFVLSQGHTKLCRYYWLQTNLFYPILLLKCELQNLLYADLKPIDFASLCLEHGLEPLPISSLLEWGAPFQMSVFCAAAIDLEQNWVKFLQ
ncbi:MAG: hypothetical protein DCC88_04300 [Spirobacillus cienkowskii]|uniref:Uncharacterized protein n=1 Tax=Spirobacillus cienkowskii TaxID=495820 RepID=A0A369KY52_9BACT|nr:MAG: hypothetical protein DCC88_04300 [Spirobacillus cienkowskii]